MNTIFMMVWTSIHSACPGAMSLPAAHYDLIDHAAESFMWNKLAVLRNIFATCGTPPVDGQR
eukprot:CAMPEP_0178452716 /NCGR_PEP_ID=MMETSP0689_2-20121128/44398_1 /TAXON_ID=160604 /ORGANISM="Amphidinium massartii, Strain CS-259" /LENGTH=61 /DNA_ID=CAMNT_0020078451 /DNA_START=448 /DNA_END=633 /DNA_ORIENTATION=+